MNQPRIGVLAVGTAALLIITFTLGGWYLVSQASGELEREFGRRLRHVGVAASAGLDPDRVERVEEDATAQELLAVQLRDIREELSLDELFLFDRSTRVVVDSHPGREPWTADYVGLQPDLLERAWGGRPGHTRVRYVAGEPFMDAYAPVLDLHGQVRYLLAVEDRQDRLAVFRGFYRTLAAVGLISAIIIAALILVQARIVRGLLEARRRGAEADRLAALSQLGATVAHEIRNPLTSLSASVQVVLRRWRKSGRVDEEMLEDLPREVERVNRIITDFLAFSREAPLDPADAAPRAFVESGVRACAPDGQVEGVSIALQVDAGSPSGARFDRDRLQQVLQNLVVNAVHAVREHDGEGAVRVRTGGERRRGGPVWWFEVCDDGPGVPEADRGRVFEPYFTSKAHGTGLGLAVSKRVIEAHGGTLECAAGPNGGARFRATLPVRI